MSWHHKKLDRRRWEAARLRVLDAARWRCAVCRLYANECDHVRPLKLGGDPYDEANLQALCSYCHAAKTRLENRRPRSPAETAWDVYVSELAGGNA